MTAQDHKIRLQGSCHPGNLDALNSAGIQGLFDMLDAMSDGVAYYNSDGKLMLFNQAFVDIHKDIESVIHHGVSFEQIVQAGIEADLWDLGGQSPEAFTVRQLEARMDSDVETLVRFNDGRFILRREFRTKDGGMIGVRSDITELKQREEELKEAKYAAVRADKAKSEFLANMSHEIRTPMNGVMGMAEILAATDLDDKQQSFTQVIIKSGAALLTILNDILDFSKIDAGQMTLNTNPFNIRDALEDVATLISSGAAEKGIELIVRIAPDVPESLIGDVGRLRQIVTNLVSNAVKFTDEGHVLIDVACTLDEANNAALKIRVEDTGCGIPEDKCALVFEKFAQVDGSASRQYEGTGLGLAISTSLVGLMDGDIGVESELGVGSCFWFTIALPIDGTQKQDRQINRIPADPCNNIEPHNNAETGTARHSNILIVVDNQVSKQVITSILDSTSLTYRIAKNGAIALTMLEEKRPHLILIDASMPVMDELETSRRIREIEAARNLTPVPIIGITGPGINNGSERCLAAGMDAYISKPLSRNMLIKTIGQVLESEENLDRAVC